MPVSPEKLVAKVAAANPKADLELVRSAFAFAAEAHRGQLRKSGEPYIVHPLATAETLADMGLPMPMIIAGLLHDVPEDTAVTIEEIEERFGSDVASIVGGITKLGKIKYRGIDRYIENLRKMFVAMAADVRVILVKFADRINNLETLGALPPHKRRRVALESLEIYAPIANRLGMQEMRVQLEDLSFKHAYPKEYEWVSALAKRAVTAKQSYINRINEEAAADFRTAGIGVVEVQGRVKHLYSLYKKLVKHERDIVRIHDLIALRVLTKTVADCYAALGIIHQRWKPLSGRIKDYISQPKPNGYRSLHTTVFCDDGEIVEFQIRTVEMHEEAERGIAAHWRYDEDGKHARAAVAGRLSWVKDLAERQRHIRDKSAYLESLETLKIDAFHDRIFVFTPKGDVIDLPDGATPVDFAYAIHSKIGDGCVAARVNDQIATLDSKLDSGDYCEIIVDKNRKAPNPDWLNFVQTSNARSHIRTAAKSKLERWLKAFASKPKEDDKKPAVGSKGRGKKSH